jgi:hypothetical protein
MNYFKNLMNAIFGKTVKQKLKSLDDNYLVSFRENHISGNNFIVYDSEDSEPVEDDATYTDSEFVKSPRLDKIEKTIKVSVNAIDVLNELERVPTNWSLEGLDDKIQILKYKAELIQKNKQSKREVQALIQCLENRKKYDV